MHDNTVSVLGAHHHCHHHHHHNSTCHFHHYLRVSSASNINLFRSVQFYRWRWTLCHWSLFNIFHHVLCLSLYASCFGRSWSRNGETMRWKKKKRKNGIFSSSWPLACDLLFRFRERWWNLTHKTLKTIYFPIQIEMKYYGYKSNPMGKLCCLPGPMVSFFLSNLSFVWLKIGG